MSATIYNRLREDMKVNMRAKNSQDLTLIKSLLSEITYAEKDPVYSSISAGKKFKDNDPAVIELLQNAILQREESISEFTKAKRADLAAKERQQIDLIKRYLPVQLTDAEVVELISCAIVEVQATGLQHTKQVIRTLKFDPTRVSRPRIVQITKQLLAQKHKANATPKP